MSVQVIRKSRSEHAPPPNLRDYDSVRSAFSWERARENLACLPGGAGINIAHEALDRHAAGADRDRVALRWLDLEGHSHDYTYARLSELTSRFANVLKQLGIKKGDCVYAVTERIPELFITALGTLKNGSVFCPIYAAYGPEPLRTRLSLGKGKLLVTTEGIYRRKLAPLISKLPELRHVLVVAESKQATTLPGTGDFRERLQAADAVYTIPPTDGEDPALLHFTSGTTGKPKGALHVHEAVIVHHESARLALDLRPGDVFWCTADPGWVTGTIYGIIAPLTVGATVLADRRGFDTLSWYRTLKQEHVNVWYTTPTAVRMMSHLGTDTTTPDQFPELRFLATVGEPLDPTAIRWAQDVFGKPFHDNWWQTETGAIMIANYEAMDVKPGSMGRPLPGIEAAIVRRSDHGAEVVEDPTTTGELALRAPWPSMFRDYLDATARYRQCFLDAWYLTGDLAQRDDDGYFWFVGRQDDAIKSSGHLIGPFEVESALMEHPSVVDAGVIGKPDALATETVKAFVTLRPGDKGDETLRRELLAHTRRRLGPAVAPREIEFRKKLPKTRSGKILRRLLKAQDLAGPHGDVSNLPEDDDGQ